MLHNYSPSNSSVTGSRKGRLSLRGNQLGPEGDSKADRGSAHTENGTVPQYLSKKGRAGTVLVTRFSQQSPSLPDKLRAVKQVWDQARKSRPCVEVRVCISQAQEQLKHSLGNSLV